MFPGWPRTAAMLAAVWIVHPLLCIVYGMAVLLISTASGFLQPGKRLSVHDDALLVGARYLFVVSIKSSSSSTDESLALSQTDADLADFL